MGSANPKISVFILLPTDETKLNKSIVNKSSLNYLADKLQTHQVHFSIDPPVV